MSADPFDGRTVNLLSGAQPTPTASTAGTEEKKEAAVPRPTHAPALGLFVYVLATSAAIGGLLFGFDTGIISGVLLYLPENAQMKPMSDLWKGLIVSSTTGMAGIAALVAGKCADVFGRRPMVVVSSAFFVLGAGVCAIGLSKYVVLGGRLIQGVAIGLASMIVPVYVGEAAPANIRGRLITGFQLMITFGLLLSNIVAGGFSYWSPDEIGWRLMFAVAGLPALVQILGFVFFLPESPRFLYQREGPDECREVLSRIYNGDEAWIRYELSEIKAAAAQELRADEAFEEGNVFLRIWKAKHVLKALCIGCALQAFQQLSGINTIMYYTTIIIRSAGIRDNHLTIWISVGTSAFNFFCTFIPMYLIERVGRRKLLFWSMAGVIVSLVLLSGSFFAINLTSASIEGSPGSSAWNVTGQETVQASFKQCSKHSNCDYCVTDTTCGFCGPPKGGAGFCLPINATDDTHSTMGVCASNATTYEFAPGMCNTNWTWAPIALIAVYLCCFAVGYAPVPWVLNAEFYPIWARGTCVSISTFFNWAFNFVISLTFLMLVETMTKFGVFLLYAGLTAVALVLFYFVVPETRNYNLDEVETLFMSKQKREEAKEAMAAAAETPLVSSAAGSDTPAQ